MITNENKPGENESGENKPNTPIATDQSADLSHNPLRWLEPGAIAQSRLMLQVFVTPRLAPGTRLGAYQLLSEIARGGMGVVYLAERADGQFEQRVAIKTVHGARSPQVHALFLRERQLLADFKHAHVARLLDGGSTEDGLLWCAMELVEGDTLDIYLNGLAPSLTKRLQLFRQLCDAVHAAHGRLFVHRDIKPSNVMIDADGSAKLLDFGIASWTQSDDQARAYSPAWASPEQLSGAAIGPASDQHQLGRILKLMLTDVLPTGERGAELQAIAARATADQVEARYASVAEFSEDLQRWIDHRAVRSYSQRWPYFLRTAIRRHPWQSAAFALLGMIAIGLISYSQWRLMQQRDIAAYQAKTAEEINQFLQDDLLRLADPNISQDANLKVSTLLTRASTSIDQRFAERPEIAAELHAMLGHGLRGLDAFDASAIEFERAQALAAKNLAADDPQRLAIELEHAELEIAQAKFPQAHQRLTALIAQATPSLGVNAELSLSARARRASAAFYAGIEPTSAIDELTALQATIDAQLGPQSALAIRALNERAIMLSNLERLADALPVRLEHIARASKAYGDNYSTVWVGRVNYAVLLRKLGQSAQALQQVEMAQQGLEKIFGVDSTASLQALNVRSRIVFDMGDKSSAIDLQRQILAARMSLLGPEHDQVAVSHVNLGGMLYADLRPAEAIDEYLQALRIRQKIFPADHVDVLTNLMLVGDTWRQQGQFAQADPYLSQALASAERTLDAARPELANIRFRYAQLKLAQQKPELARAPLQAALAAYQLQLGPDHKRTLEAMKLLATLPVPKH
jgi:eukaryotic-like serine/threonine-protein kinase